MATLQDIRNKVRRVTARYTQESLNDAQIDDYINTFYLLEFPENIRNLKLLVPFTFTTTPGVACYDFPYQAGFTDPNGLPSSGYSNIKPPAYCQGYLLRYFQDKTQFYAVWPKRTQIYQIGSGNGTTGPYIGMIPFAPMLRAEQDIYGKVTEANVIISAQQGNKETDGASFVFTATDNPVQRLSGPIGSTVYSPSDTGYLSSNGQNLPNSFINYITGEFQLNTTTEIPNGVPINVQAIPFMGSRPVDFLFYNQQMIVRPVPADVYQIEVQGVMTPVAMIANSDFPQLDEWWQFLALGAAKLVYTDYPDPEGLEYCMKLFQEQLLLAQRRSLVQFSTQRANTLFSTQYKQFGPGYYLPYTN